MWWFWHNWKKRTKSQRDEQREKEKSNIFCAMGFVLSERLPSFWLALQSNSGTRREGTPWWEQKTPEGWECKDLDRRALQHRKSIWADQLGPFCFVMHTRPACVFSERFRSCSVDTSKDLRSSTSPSMEYL